MESNLFSNVSEQVFPGLSYCKSEINSERLNRDDEIVSNLPLQMSLYFNVVFFPFWLATIIVMLPIKYLCLSGLYQFIVGVTLAAIILIECIRLYLGYAGNLQDKIPELAGFWMLSMLLQSPLQLLLLMSLWSLQAGALEVTLQSVMLSLMLTQLGTGFVALRRAARHSAERFHLAQFSSGGGDTSHRLQR